MDKEIGERLRVFRESVNKRSQEDLAAQLQLKQRTYAYYEIGRNKIPQNVLKKLSILGLDLNYLITGNASPPGSASPDLQAENASIIALRAQVEILQDTIVRMKTSTSSAQIVAGERKPDSKQKKKP